ncbi:hypothetical protein D0962_28860 [Leptolyngbyaceae cyanobacterium CCMR0082]|uniref:Uncharacterized protein n=1 Tax=Adonisia turfae CCMR0082 TaxID=2304604 RepID=A0A6M0SGI6_9CYAN|nr:hypothetical protein [Adonisia turfae]NEZ66722.1 hypothetical protein [Adonisia turfae CCMR0082]
MTSVLEALKSAQFVVNADGQKVAVQLSPVLWQALLTWLETAESIPSLEELLDTTVNVASHEDVAVFSCIETIQSDQTLVSAATQLSEPAFANVWNNPEDDIYNES